MKIDLLCKKIYFVPEYLHTLYTLGSYYSPRFYNFLLFIFCSFFPTHGVNSRNDNMKNILCIVFSTENVRKIRVSVNAASQLPPPLLLLRPPPPQINGHDVVLKCFPICFFFLGKSVVREKERGSEKLKRLLRIEFMSRN